MDLWVKRSDVAPESQVKGQGDFGKLVLNGKDIKSFEERRGVAQRRREGARRLQSGLADVAAAHAKKVEENRAREEAAKVDESDDALDPPSEVPRAR